jgi:hypothetical protein
LPLSGGKENHQDKSSRSTKKRRKERKVESQIRSERISIENNYMCTCSNVKTFGTIS